MEQMQPVGVRSRFAAKAVDLYGRRASLSWTAILFWLIFYMALPENLLGPELSGDVTTKIGTIAPNILNRNIKIGMIAVSIYLIWKRWHVIRALSRFTNVGQTAFIILAVLSTLWSIDPEATILRLLSFAPLLIVCIALPVTNWHPRAFQPLAIPPLMFIIVMSLILGFLFPDRIIETGDGISLKDAWHGITHQKNEFGMISGCAVIICANTWWARERRPYWAIAGAAAGFLCLILSRSNTSLFATVTGLASMWLLMRVSIIRRNYSTHLVITIAVVLGVYELVIMDVLPGVNTLLGPIAAMVGKNTTFSARSQIWDVIKVHIEAAPLLGTGYGAYWTGPSPHSPSFVLFMRLMYFYPTESHNGYLEIINDLGFAGLACLIAFLYQFLRQALLLLRIDRNQSALYLGLLFQLMVINFSESEWFAPSDIFAVFSLASSFMARGLLAASHAEPSIRVAGR